MVIELVHAAIGRKMLCKPANSLIADSELVCAIAMALQIFSADTVMVEEIAQATDAEELQKKFLTCFKFPEEEKDERLKNLLSMIQNYRGAEHEMDREYQEIFWYGYQHEILYPFGNFSSMKTERV